MPRYFRLSEAEEFLPAVERDLRTGVRLKAALIEAEQELFDSKQRITLNGGSMVNLNRLTAVRDRRQSSAEGLKTALEKIEEMGVLVKDLDIGLIDFPALYEDREVYLCWKLGETGISHWHGVDEGFAGRKAIDQEFRDKLE